MHVAGASPGAKSTPGSSPRATVGGQPRRGILRLLLLGALLAYAGTCALLAAREDDRFGALAKGLGLSGEHTVSEAARLMDGIHAFYSPRRDTKLGELTLEQREGWRSWLIGSVGDHLATACGECGAYSSVLARTAQLAGWDVRLVQILDDSGQCTHVANELRTDEGWIFVDAMFEVLGQREGLTDVLDTSELAAWWTSHPGDVPPDYAENHWIPDRYRYTNWSAIPVVLPAARKVLELVKGSSWVEQFSLRPWFLNLHRARMWMALGLAALVLLMGAVSSWRRRRRTRAIA